MVVIICLQADCQSIFEQTYYNSYEECYQEALTTAQYMKQTYPETSGEVFCMNQAQFDEFNQFLKNGGKPTIDPTLMEQHLPSA